MEKRVHYAMVLLMRLDRHTSVFGGLFVCNIGSAFTHPCLSNWSWSPLLPLTLQPSTFSSEREKVLRLRSPVRQHALKQTHTHGGAEMWRASVDPQACSALIWTNPREPRPGLSEGPRCASSRHSCRLLSFHHRHLIWGTRKSIGSQYGKKLYVFCFSSGIHMPMIAGRVSSTHAAGWNVPLNIRQTHYLPSKIILSVLGSRGAAGAFGETSIQPVSVNSFSVLQVAAQTATFPPWGEERNESEEEGSGLISFFCLPAQMVPDSCAVWWACPLSVLECERAHQCRISFPTDADEAALKSLGQSCARCTLVTSCQRASPNL